MSAPASGAPPRPRRSSTELNYWRDSVGCTVTWRDQQGVDHVRSESGYVRVALRRICDRIPEGCEVRSISTPRTIMRDLQNDPRTYGGGKHTRVDRYSVERQLLAKIGRMDLLPEEARA